MAVRGKCNCGKKAVAEYLVYAKKYCTTLKFCEKCKPREHYNLQSMTLIHGK